MKKIAVAVLMSIGLSACQSSGGTIRDSHTGVTVVYSQKHSISGGLLQNLNAQAAFSTRRGYVVAIEFLHTGGDWHFFREAWSNGRQFRYAVEREKVLGCSAGCSLLETGYIFMDEPQFRQAAQSGFSFRLLGRGGSVTGTVPASAFKEVLSRKGG